MDGHEIYNLLSSSPTGATYEIWKSLAIVVLEKEADGCRPNRSPSGE